jgi:hypothetical protein
VFHEAASILGVSLKVGNDPNASDEASLLGDGTRDHHLCSPTECHIVTEIFMVRAPKAAEGTLLEA